MKRLGIVENLSYDGSLLVRSQFAPAPGTRVVDRRHRTLGTVVRAFGPVREPFVTVRPEATVPLSLFGSDVYVSEGNDAQESGTGRGSH